MKELVTFTVWFMVAMLVIKGLNRKKKKKVVNERLKDALELMTAAKETQKALDASTRNLVEKIREAKASNSELTELVVQDALNREHRAKAALVAVLKQNNCSDTEIEAVMRTVDADPEFRW
jgi:hypothetical protein